MRIQIYKKNTGNGNFRRRLATLPEVKYDLKNELRLMFTAFYEAVKLYRREVQQTPPQSRSRGFEASLLNSKMIQSVQKHFPVNWEFSRYKRFTLRVNGYIVLFKKLTNKNMPMNIRTKAVDAISNQLTMPLFNDASFCQLPILHFGYHKDKFGQITNPRLVYIDEGNVKWVIDEASIETFNSVVAETKTEEATPVLKSKAKKKTG